MVSGINNCSLNTNYCYSDPSLVVDKASGNVICVFNGNTSFAASNQTDGVHIFTCRSTDNGITWNTPVDITDQIYGPNCTNPISKNWLGLFMSSGRLTQLRNGRILGMMDVRDANGQAGDFTAYSDDGGNSWATAANSNAITPGRGNEAKTVQLDDNSILMSLRAAPYRVFNKSTDDGVTWGTAYNSTLTDPSCNGDILRYTSVNDGYDKSRLIHSLAYNSSSRKNVSLSLSYDEGKTWPINKTIDAESSAYSSTTILKDGTIGIFYEDGENGDTYNLYYARVSLNWLSSGTDTYLPPPSTPSTPAQNGNHRGKHLHLDGATQYLKITDTIGLNYVPASTGLSITFWVKDSSAATANARLISNTYGGAAGSTGYDWFENAGRIGPNIRYGIPQVSSTNSGAPYSSTIANYYNNWHHLALIYDPANSNIYVYADGVQIESYNKSNFGTTASNYSGSTPNICFGILQANASIPISYYFKGDVDDIRFYSGVLSQSQVAADMTASVDNTTPNLLVAYDFENATSVTAPNIASSGASYDATLVGNPTFTLPIKLISFTGQYETNNNQVALLWQTSTEVNIQSISLQYSNNGQDFATVYSTAPKGGTVNHYSFNHAAQGTDAYYRLELIGTDGNISYSNIIHISLSANTNVKLSVAPNPASNTISVETSLSGNINVQVYDVAGRSVIQKNENAGRFVLNISSLSKGVYILKASNKHTQATTKFIRN